MGKYLSENGKRNAMANVTSSTINIILNIKKFTIAMRKKNVTM